MITQSRLKEICDYHPGGFLLWKAPGKKRKVGDIVGSLGTHGYIETCIDRKRYLVHGLIWLYHTGEFPAEHTDHINGYRVDNRIENLRAVTNRQNNFNQSKRKKKTSSKYRGVSWHTSRSLWRATIKLEKSQKFLGYYESEKEAALAYNAGAMKYYGEFAKLNAVE